MAAKKKSAARKGASAKPATGRTSAGAKRPAAVKKKPLLAKRAPAAAPYSDGKWASTFTPRAPGERRYWLVKSEPGEFSFDDLLRAPERTTHWDGVRNFAARNFLRDGMKLGDRVLFYQSSTDPQAIVGTCEVVREAYPDHTALDPKHAHYDDASDPAAPTWFMVDVRALEPLHTPVTLTAIKAWPALAGMALLRIGRLSVTPVTKAEWDVIERMGRG